VGGSIAHADAAAELPLCLTVLGGVVVARSASGRREIAAADFFAGHFTTTLAPDELVIETVWPVPADGWSFAFEELAQRHGDFALAMAACALRLESGRVAEMRVGVGAVVDRPTLLDVEPEGDVRSAVELLELHDNLHASAAYQRHLTAVLVERAIRRARANAS
jgi:CO/xanthine dehydrogenase FAD-binding subunit